MANGGGFVAMIIGCVIGAGGYALYDRKETPPTPPVIRAEIDHECFSNSTNYECSFFNRGRGQGAVCVKVYFQRAKELDKYANKHDFNRILGNRVCSGVLSQGQDSLVKGTGFFGGGSAVTGAEFCTVAGSAAPLEGCTMDTRVVAQTQ
jgi:hypothetical protein